ncbi:MAG: transcriptional repressor LexA [bacterium]|nr:transcriptional repressor LexA [bacterium]
MALTRRQKDVLDFLVQFVEENSYSPSYEEIAAGLRLASLATVHKHISALETKGYLRRGFNQSRSIEPSEKYLEEYRRQHPRPIPSPGMPLAGRIAAGLPVETYEAPETLTFSDFVGDKDTYALEVGGDSMIDDHIMSGDYVLIERTNSVDDGAVVVALVDGSETTLKRFYREPDGQVRLQPANAEMEPILVPADQVQVQGRLLAVLRKYN